MSTIKNNVLTILDEVPEARNSDMILTKEYWKRYNEVDVPIEIQRRLTPQTSLARIRARIQEEGEYPADELVQQERRRLERECRNSILRQGDLPSSLTSRVKTGGGIHHVHESVQSLVSKLSRI
jgi:hypothetical protein